MLMTHLTLFIIFVFISLVISMYLMETKPVFSIPWIFIGLIFSVICTYGFWNVQIPVIYSDDTFVLESVNYGEPYSYIFVFIFFIFLMFFFRAGWNMWMEALKTKGEFDYSRFDYQQKKKNYYR